MDNGFELIAHRGYRERYPENTLPAFEAAIEAGTDAVELDVQFCQDGTPVVLHDADLRRVAGVDAHITELEAADLAGHSVHEPERFGDRFRPTGIPTLRACAERLAALRPVKVFVEVKRESLARHALPQGLAAVLDACAPIRERAVIISFDDDVLQEARALSDLPVGWVLPEWSLMAEERAETLQPEYLFVSQRKLPPPPTPLWEGPWRWAVYEVNEPGVARDLARRGVYSIETAAVETMVKALKPGWD